jgi:very-short-patch-repair endonuclease
MEINIAKIAARQDGVITLAQLRHEIPARHRQRKLIEHGGLVRVAPGVYAINGSPDTYRRRLRSGLLSLGHDSWVSYEAAAQLQGLDRSRPDIVEFTVARGRSVQCQPFTIHTSHRIPAIDRVEVDGLRCLSATRTVIDLAHARRSTARIEAAIDSAIRKGLSAPHTIATRLETLRGQGRWGCLLIERLVVDSGGHSPLERRFLQICREAGLSRPLTQAIHRKGQRHIARVDFLFAAEAIVIEVSGQHGHSSPTERRRDAQRRNELQDLGRRVYEYTYADVTESPEMVRRTLLKRLCDENG